MLEGLGEYVRLFVKKAPEEAVQEELTEFLGHRPYGRWRYRVAKTTPLVQEGLESSARPMALVA